LYRETPEFIKSVDKTLDETAQYYIDIPELAQSIIKYMNGMHDQHGQVSEKIEFQSEKCTMFDYIFICFMLGNDFMPHFPALNIRTGGIDTLLDAYRQTMGSIPGEYIICFNKSSLEYKINWANYKKFIQMLCGDSSIVFSGQIMNPKGVRFLEGAKTDGTFQDPWDSSYFVKMDCDDSGGVNYYFAPDTVENIRLQVIAVSLGKNKTLEDPDKKITKTCDDVFSWR
jgi:hypothetical protein